jgi:chorismate dehydratase
MTTPIRLGAVSYLNVRPLVFGLDQHTEVTLRFDVPSECAQLLARGEIDLGMVPSITYHDHPGHRVVPGVCIGSFGAVASVALFSRRPLRDIRSIAFDTSSRTSVALLRVLCRRRFDISPTFAPHAPDLAAMLATADAALMIGDAALFADPLALGAEKVDLGEAWTDMTALPFVWAFWAGPDTPAIAGVVPVLKRAAAEGMRHTYRIAAEYCEATPERVPIAQHYLREHLMFHFDDRAIEGVTTFYGEAFDLGLAPSASGVEFFPDADEDAGGRGALPSR